MTTATFAVTFILAIAYPAWVCGKDGEPCIGSRRWGIFDMAPFALFLAFFIAALAGANPVACYAILGAAVGSFAWKVGDEVNAGGAARRRETTRTCAFQVVDHEIAFGDRHIQINGIRIPLGEVN